MMKIDVKVIAVVQFLLPQWHFFGHLHFGYTILHGLGLTYYCCHTAQTYRYRIGLLRLCGQ